MNLTKIGELPRERIIKGKSNWWFLGPGGVARLRDAHVTPEGTLRPDAERSLREQGMFQTGPARSYLLTVLTSTDCNLGCGYCFQNTGQDPTGGDRPPRIAHARLTSETITAALEFAARQMAATGLEKLRVLLFGGEPLLNPKGCLELLARSADYGLVSASMISNLTLLTPRLAGQLEGLGLRSVQVTFDGDRHDHDQIRVRRSHGGTFDAILANLARASQAAPRIRWQLRVNVSHCNRPGVDAMIDRIAKSVDPARCQIYFVRVGDAGIGYRNDLRSTSALAADFARWQRRALDLGFSVNRPRAHTPCHTCSFPDGRYGSVVNADGVLASCWSTAGQPGWEVGTVRDGYLPSDQRAGRWVACEHNYLRSEEEDRASAAFQDAVDAAVLDYLSETGRL